MEILIYFAFLFTGILLGFFAGRLAAKIRLAAAETELRNLQERNSKLEQEHSALSEKFRNEFKAVADAILSEQTQKVQADAQVRIETLLAPVREKLAEFQNSIAQGLAQQSRDNATLKEQIRQLTELNTQVSTEASRLTNALRGEAKTRGNWGEMILERLLEASGLEKGLHYETQVTLKDNDNKQYRPDVVLHFPEQKDVIIDAKVSLVDYEKLTAASDPTEQTNYLKQHFNSLKKHIDDLGSKNYNSLQGINSLDLVFMFVPIEAAFIEALRHDASLYDYAFRKKVVLCTPSTLLATLRLIGTMWQQYNQNKNAQKIAEEGGKLYDKFCGFLNDFQEIGTKLSAAVKAYDDALGKLSTGRGNLIRQAEKFRTLGIKNTKSIPEKLSRESEDDSDEE